MEVINLHNLEVLDLFGTDLNSFSFEVLKHMPNLRELSLDGIVKPEDVRALSKAIPLCKIIIVGEGIGGGLRGIKARIYRPDY
jgi:hypothetical protein